MRTIHLPFVVLACSGALGSATVASAAEVTRVLSGRSIKDFDVDVSLVWQHESRSVFIQWEYASPAGVLLANDLKYNQSRDSLQLGAAVGFAHDFALSLSLSFVL